MQPKRVIYASLLVNSAFAAAIPIDKYKREVAGPASETVQLEARDGFLSSLLGGLLDWFDNDDGSSAAAPTTTAPAATAPAATTSAVANTSAVATPVAATPATSTAEATSTAATTSSDDGWWFPAFTWPSRSTSTSSSVVTSATGAVSVGTYTPTTTSSEYVSPASSSTSSDSESSSGSSDNTGGTEVESLSRKSGGIAYSPYTKGGQCKTQQEVAHDMQVLSGHSIIRLYGVDCNGVDNTLASIGSNQKLFVGIYNIDSNSINNDLGTLKEAVEGSKRGWSAIDTVSIGNELVNFGKATPSQISTAIQTAKNWFKQNASGYSGSIVSVDTLVAVLNNPDLCDASDYLAVNSHPFWDGNVQPGNSGSFLQSQISQLKSVCNNNKRILITESGWPTKGDNYGSCVPSVANQLTAIKSIVDALGDDVLMFTAYNDYWKDGGQYGVEKYWGIFGDPSA